MGYICLPATATLSTQLPTVTCYGSSSSYYHTNRVSINQSHLFLKMFLFKSFSAIILAVILSICVKAETHTVVFINKWVVFVDSSVDPFSLTRALDAVLVLYVNELNEWDDRIQPVFIADPYPRPQHTVYWRGLCNKWSSLVSYCVSCQVNVCNG